MQGIKMEKDFVGLILVNSTEIVEGMLCKQKGIFIVFTCKKRI